MIKKICASVLAWLVPEVAEEPRKEKNSNYYPTGFTYEELMTKDVYALNSIETSLTAKQLVKKYNTEAKRKETALKILKLQEELRVNDDFS